MQIKVDSKVNEIITLIKSTIANIDGSEKSEKVKVKQSKKVKKAKQNEEVFHKN